MIKDNNGTDKQILSFLQVDCCPEGQSQAPAQSNAISPALQLNITEVLPLHDQGSAVRGDQQLTHADAYVQSNDIIRLQLPINDHEYCDRRSGVIIRIG